MATDETVEVKLIELSKTELKPGAKYIVCLSPQWGSYYDSTERELARLVGTDNFMLVPVPPNDLKVYEVIPND